MAVSQKNVPLDDETSLFHHFPCLPNAARSVFVEWLIPSSYSVLALKNGSYPKFTLALSPVDRASLVPGGSCSVSCDRLAYTEAGVGNRLGWEGPRGWAGLKHTEMIPRSVFVYK